MKRRMIAMLLCIVMLGTCMGAALLLPPDIDLVDKASGAAVSEVAVPKCGRVTLTPNYESAAELGYQWQISSDGELWVDIYGQTAAELTMSYAMVCNMLSAEGTAQVRCLVTEGDSQYKSSAVEVSIDYAEAVQPAAAAAPVVMSSPASGVALMSEDGVSTLAAEPKVTVSYVYENGKEALSATTQMFEAGSDVSWTVPYQTIPGYTPEVTAADGVTITKSASDFTISIESIKEDYDVTVTYRANDVSYSVTYYYQKLELGDNYEAEQKTYTAKVGQTVPTTTALERVNAGFSTVSYEQTNAEADGSTNVSIYCDRMYYLVKFDLQGGSGVDAVYAPFGSKLDIKEDPTKPGYTFNGWSPELREDATVPAGGTTYTAQWSENVGTTKYTVAYYHENPNDDQYTYMGSTTKYGTTGQKIDGEASKGDSFTGRDDTHFYYSHATSATINGDGSTVIKVYYKRNEYTMTFVICTKNHDHKADKKNDSWGALWWADSCSHNTKVKEIKAKYGADIREEYAAVVNANQLTYNGKTYNLYGHRWNPGDNALCTALVVSMPGYNTEFWLRTDDSNKFTIYYMYETDDGAVSHDGKRFSVGAKIENIGMSYIGTDDYTSGNAPGYMPYVDDVEEPENVYSQAATDMNGNTKAISIMDGGSYRLFYYALENTLEFKVVGEGIDHTRTIKTGFPIKAGENDSPDKYNVPTGYKFDGTWYYDEACTEPVDWSKDKMPAGNMVVYTKWVPETYTVTFLENEGDEAKVYATRSVQYETIMSDVPANPKPEKEDQNFVGWFYRDSSGVEHAFDPANMQVKSDMTLYAKWSSNNIKSYIVQFVVKDSKTEVATYKHGSAAVGKSITVSAKAGTQLYTAYQNGYFPTKDSITFEIKDTDNTYVIEYVKKTVDYTVHYYKVGTTEQVLDDKVVKNYDKSIVTESFVPLTGTEYANYMPVAPLQQTKILSADSENEIFFYYEENPDMAAYTISHYKLSANGNKELIGTTESGFATKGTALSATLKDVGNYTFDLAASKAASTTDCGLSVSGSNVSAKLLDGGVNIELIYKENTVTANYQPLTGGSVSKSSETVGVVTGSFSGSTATASEGYTFAGWYSDAACTAKVSDSANYVPTSKTNATYYARFTENTVTINYVALTGGSVSPGSETLGKVTGTINGSTATANEGYTFAGWYSDKACTVKVSDSANYVPTSKTNATYYAKFTENTVTINYAVVGPEGCGTVSPTSEAVNIFTGAAGGSTAQASNTFKFVGWYKDAGCTQAVDSSWVAGNKITPKQVDGKNVAATYYAKFDYNLTTLTITKTVKDGKTYDANDMFIFTVTDSKGKEFAKVTLKADEEAVIDGLTVGERYTVSEDTGWSWRYNVTGGATKSITIQPTGNDVTFENTLANDNWLGASAYAVNQCVSNVINKIASAVSALFS